MKALGLVVSILLFGNFAMASAGSLESAASNIVEVDYESHGERVPSERKKPSTSPTLRCPKDSTRSYRSGKYIHYELCSEAGRWKNVGTRRVR